MTVIVLAADPEREADRYMATLESVGFDPTRLGELTPEDAAFCVSFLHSRLLWLTQEMQAKASEPECEAAVAYCLHCGEQTLDLQVTLATRRMQAGLPHTLRDLAALWVSNCAIKKQIQFAMERNASAVN